MNFRSACLSLLILAALRAQDPEQAKPARRQPAPDYDIRELTGHAPASLETGSIQEITRQRRAAADAFLAASGSDNGPAVRMVLNDHGLPKAMFHEQGALSAGSQQDPEQIARNFLRGSRALFHFTDSEIDGLRMARHDQSDGVHFLMLEQTLAGIPVFHGQVKIAVNQSGQVVHAGVGDVIPELRATPAPTLNPEQAVKAAFESAGVEPPESMEALPAENGKVKYRNPKGGQFTDISVEPYWFPMTAASARLAWRVLLELDPGAWYEILVDAEDGRTLFRHNLYRPAAQGRVWKESPLKGPREVVPFPESWIPAASLVTTGNNADAFVDADGDLVPDRFASNTQEGRAYSPSQNFDFNVFEGSDPRSYPAASITNLFYFVNIAHDYFYDLGFTEAAGNFQRNNFGRGGAGNDPVLAHAQFLSEFDGFANNAGFATTPDGTPPRMVMGIFTRRTSGRSDDLDPDYDGQIVIHEYGHGVTIRMVGGGSDVSCLRGPQAGAMGEGWSDYFASSFFNNPVQGAYVTQNRERGIRRASYEGYRFTYEDLGNEGYEVHLDGEIWAAVLWDLRKALGQAVTDRLVVNALRLTPCRPTMIDARDAILAADQATNRGVNRLRIWQVFALRGMGSSAAGENGVAPLGAIRSVIHTAAFDVPGDLQAGNRPPGVTSRPPAPVSQAALYTYDIDAVDPEGGAVAYELLQGPPGMIIDRSSGVIRWTATFVGARAKVAITDAQGGRAIHGFWAAVETPLTPGTPVPIAGARGTAAFATIVVPPGTPVLQVTLRGGSGDPDVVLVDPDGMAAGASARIGSVDTRSIPTPKPGVWLALIVGFEAYAGVSLTGLLPVPTAIPANGSRTGLSGELSSETFFQVAVPPGGSSFRISTSGGFGDVDLFVRRGQPPDCQVIRVTSRIKGIAGSGCSDLRSVGFDTNSESVSVDTPQAGTWYINLSAPASYSGVTLRTSLDIPPTLVVSAAELVFSAVEGRGPPPAQTVAISNTAGPSLNWTAQAATTSGGDWLRLSQASGSGTATITVSVDTSALAPGTYRGSIVVNGQGLLGSPQTLPVTLTLAARPVLRLGSASLSFTALPGQDPPAQSVTIVNAGGSTLEWSAAAVTSSGGNWLVLSPAQGSGNATLQVAVRSSGLAGTYSGTITVTAPGAGGSPAVLNVSLVVGLPVLLSREGIVNASSFSRNSPLTVNEIVSLFGENLTEPCSAAPGAANPCPRAQGFPLPTQLGTTRVTINGVPAPLLVATPTQINLLTPFGLTGPTATVIVTRGVISSPPVTLPLADQSLGVFTVLSSGAGAGIVLHADGRLVTREAPMEPDEILVIYTTGMGAVSPPIGTGQPAPSTAPLSETVLPVRVFFDGGEGRILFSGPAPGFAGLYQINVRAPAFLGRRFPIVRVQSPISISNDTSAGGPSILDISPNAGRRGADLTLTVRGVNLAPLSVLRIGGEDIGVAFRDGPLQTLTATIPGRLLGQAGEVLVTVADPTAPAEAPSNAVPVRVAAGP